MQVPENQHYMTDWDLPTRLSAALDTLRPAEKRVAQFLLEQGDQYKDITLSDLAEKAGCSQAAVVHMCQSLGLSGFREFRLLWVQQSATRAALGQSESEMFGGVISELLYTEQLLAANLAQAADSIARAKKVFFFGSGGSGLIAELGAEGLAVAGCLAFTFPSDQRIIRSFFDNETVIVVISHKGENKVLEEALQCAQNADAIGIVITSRPESPLASRAAVLLVTSTPGGREQHLATSEVRAIQMAAVHALITAVAERMTPEEVDEGAFRRLMQSQKKGM